MIRRVIVLAVLAATLAVVALPTAAHAGAVPTGTRYWDFCPNGNCDRGWVTGEVYGVEVYSDSTFATLYYYGRGKAQIEWGARRLLAYYVRLYGIRSDGSYVRLAVNETDRYDVGGAVGLRTPNVNLDTGPCDLRVKFGLGIRWNDGSFGARGAWSHVFTNYDNPNCA
jgi:hypothetical protein